MTRPGQWAAIPARWVTVTALAVGAALSAAPAPGATARLLADLRRGASSSLAWSDVRQLTPIGDRSAINRAVNSMAYGDAPSFDAFMRLALPDLQKANAGMKHAVFISDGDPQAPSRSLLQSYIDGTTEVHPNTRYQAAPSAAT